jgi:hypothetical protein
MNKQQTLNNFFQISSTTPPAITSTIKRNSDDDSIISTPPKIMHLEYLDELEIAEPNNATQPLQRINDIGLFINRNLKDAEKNLVSK